MADQPAAVLVARTPTTGPAPVSRRQNLSERMSEAAALARAGRDILPPAYRESQGACLLALDFAAKHDLDLLTVFQNVSFINGKPLIQAELRKEFAARAGYQVRLDELTAERCQVTLLDSSGSEVGQWISTIGNDGQDKSTWRQYPRQMLYANAVRNVCKFHASGLPSAIQGEPEDATIVDDVAAEISAIVEDTAPADDGQFPPPVDGEPLTVADLKQALRSARSSQAKLLAAMQRAIGTTASRLSRNHKMASAARLIAAQGWMAAFQL